MVKAVPNFCRMHIIQAFALKNLHFELQIAPILCPFSMLEISQEVRTYISGNCAIEPVWKRKARRTSPAQNLKCPPQLPWVVKYCWLRNSALEQWPTLLSRQFYKIGRLWPWEILIFRFIWELFCHAPLFWLMCSGCMVKSCCIQLTFSSRYQEQHHIMHIAMI